MDEYLILEFLSLAEAESCLDALNILAANYLSAQGYSVADLGSHIELIGKNAATGEDMPDAARTTTWDSIKQSPENTFWFSSPTHDPRFPDWQQTILDNGFTGAYVEKILPAEWRAQEN